MIGAGAGIGVVGIVLEVAAQSAYNEYDRKVLACNMNSQGCPTTSDLTSIRDRGDTQKMMGFVGYSVAGAAIATGVVLAILNRPQPYQIRAEDLQEEQSKHQLSVAPLIGPNVTGAMVQGRF